MTKQFWCKCDCGGGHRMSVYRVDGFNIRQTLDVGFIGGGHHHVEKYIPADEIWIEAGFKEGDEKAFLLHEITEHNLMIHQNLSYEKAHELANKAEERFRTKELGAKTKVRSEGDI